MWLWPPLCDRGCPCPTFQRRGEPTGEYLHLEGADTGCRASKGWPSPSHLSHREKRCSLPRNFVPFEPIFCSFQWVKSLFYRTTRWIAREDWYFWNRMNILHGMLQLSSCDFINNNFVLSILLFLFHIIIIIVLLRWEQAFVTRYVYETRFHFASSNFLPLVMQTKCTWVCLYIGDDLWHRNTRRNKVNMHIPFMVVSAVVRY